MQNKKPRMRANRNPWFPGIMEEAYRQRYTERDIMDWICGLKNNEIAIMPHLFLQVNLKILDKPEMVKPFSEKLLLSIFLDFVKTEVKRGMN